MRGATSLPFALAVTRKSIVALRPVQSHSWLLITEIHAPRRRLRYRGGRPPRTHHGPFLRAVQGALPIQCTRLAGGVVMDYDRLRQEEVLQGDKRSLLLNPPAPRLTMEIDGIY